MALRLRRHLYSQVGHLSDDHFSPFLKESGTLSCVGQIRSRQFWENRRLSMLKKRNKVIPSMADYRSMHKIVKCVQPREKKDR